jgi:predicted ATPase/DNA-binding winged helix-turn-helix (wHTH) protein
MTRASSQAARNATAEVVSFGSFELCPAERWLRKEGSPVKLGSRALDILLVLVERAGEVIGTKELMARVWPGLFVEEVSLRVHIAALRKALDEGDAGVRHVSNMPGRGYSFTTPLSRTFLDSSKTVAEAPIDKLYRLPPPLVRLVGRDEAVDEITKTLASDRFVTIVGPGGIGKTTVALSVGQAMLSELRGAICFVELSSLGDPGLLTGTVASALGLPVQSADPLPSVIAHLRGKRTLLILDSVERLAAEVASMSERLLAEAPDLAILATSREVLRAEGETVHRLSGLASPPEKPGLAMSDILAFPATRLLMERAKAGNSSLVFSDRDAPLIANICRKLGGIALAIELAAGRVGTLNLNETAALLDSEFALRWPGRRTAPPRHQTLSATLDWSYNLLSEIEQTVLRRLSVFVAGFTLDGARRVMVDSGVEEATAFEAVAGLLAKSLASADTSGAIVRYRLLDTTRTYAAMKLAHEDETSALRRWHALYFRDLLKKTTNETEALPDTPRATAGDIDDIRAALTWAFGPEGDAAIGVDLAAYSIQIWLGKTLFIECRDWLYKAVAADRGRDREPTPEQLMIWTGLASVSIFTVGIAEDTRATWNKTLDLAEKLQDAPRQVYAYLALWAMEERAPLYDDALDRALKCANAVRRMSDPGAVAMAEWMLGVTRHHLGQLGEAEAHLRRALDTDTEASRHAQLNVTGYDRRVDAMVELANVVWLKGLPEQAERWGARAMEEARAGDYALTLAAAMAWTGLNRFLSEPDIDAIEHEIVDLVEHARTHALAAYQGFGLCLLGLCQARRGQYDGAEPLVDKGLQFLSEAKYGVFNTFVRAQICEAAIAADRVSRAREYMKDLEREDRNPEHWCTPEILRVKALLAATDKNDTLAEAWFSQSTALAQQQGALSWELRTATSLARSRAEQHRPREAAALLEPVFARFNEGFATADLLAAKAVLEELGRPANDQ